MEELSQEVSEQPDQAEPAPQNDEPQAQAPEEPVPQPPEEEKKEDQLVEEPPQEEQQPQDEPQEKEADPEEVVRRLEGQLDNIKRAGALSLIDFVKNWDPTGLKVAIYDEIKRILIDALTRRRQRHQ